MLAPMKTALIAVDVQNDFITRGSQSAHPDAERIVDPLVKVGKEVDLVVASRDWHPKGHFSFKTSGLGPHCIQDTAGARIVPKVRKLTHYVISKGVEQDVDSYSAFSGQTLRPKRTLGEILTEHEIERVIVGGIGPAVAWTALDSAASGYLTIVGLDIIAIPDEELALENWQRAGVTVQNVAA